MQTGDSPSSGWSNLAVRTCFALAISVLIWHFVSPAISGERFPPLAGASHEIIVSAIAKERRSREPVPVTGITVPHHLLAADMIARGVAAARGNTYDRIVVISPEHFRRSKRLVATTRNGFDTVMGAVETDIAAVDSLLSSDIAEASNLFQTEHGVSAVLPFLAEAFPHTPVVVAALNIGSEASEWNHIFEALRRVVTPRTLVVQSTDYSHYLSPAVARARDQETLNMIAAGGIDAVAGLHQSNHMDSKAAQYVQMRLQRDVFGSAVAVIGNRNSYEYVTTEGRTTSYIVMAYGPDQAALSSLSYDDHQIVYFGGDVLLGRHFTESLLKPDIRAALIREVRARTGARPLVVNLEGVVLGEVPTGTPPSSS